MFVKDDFDGRMDQRKEGDEGRICSWRVVLEEFFRLLYMLKCLLYIRDLMKNKLFLFYRGLELVELNVGECKG